MKKTIYFITIMIIAFSIISGCKKGDTGPAGVNGTNGTNGVANISSYIRSIAPNGWGNPLNGVYYVGYYCPWITDADKDVVLTFVKVTYRGTWYSLPIANFYYSGDDFRFSYATQSVILAYTFTSVPNDTITIKIVTIPPTMKKPDIDYNSYEAINKAYNLNN